VQTTKFIPSLLPGLLFLKSLPALEKLSILLLPAEAAAAVGLKAEAAALAE
jgi:hypothetical protein